MTIVFVEHTNKDYVLSTDVYDYAVVNWCKGFSQDVRSYDPTTKKWSFDKYINEEFMVMLEIQCEMENWTLVVADDLRKGKYLNFTGFLDSRYLRIINPIPRSVYDEFMALIGLPMIKYYDLSTRIKEIRSKGWKIYVDELAKNIIHKNQALNREKIDFGLAKDMYEFQKFNAKFLVNGGLEASETGLGKSIIMLGIISRHFKEGNVTKILVICLKDTIKNWADKFDEFAPHLRYTIIQGSPKKRAKLWAEDTQVQITNLEMAKNDIKSQRKLQRWTGVVVDECQRIKNWETKTAKAIKSVKVPYRWGLSATPVENKPEDIYSIMSWIKPDLFGRYEHFRKAFIVEKEIQLKNGNSFMKKLGYKNLSVLSARLSGIMVRQIADEVEAELPKIIEEVIYVEPSTDQVRYTKFIKDLIRAGEVTTITPPTAFRQVAVDPMLLWESSGEIGQMVRDQLKEPKQKTSPKTHEIMQRCLSIKEEGKKVIVFGKFVKYLKKIGMALKEAKINFVEYHGDVFIDEEVIGEVGQRTLLEMGQGRETSLQIFYDDPTVAVMLCSKAGAIGLDGLQATASHIIHADQEWTEAGNDQRTGRIRRFGQVEKSVVSATFITRDTYDERVDMIVKEKGDIFKQIVSGSTETEIGKAIVEQWLEEK